MTSKDLLIISFSNFPTLINAIFFFEFDSLPKARHFNVSKEDSEFFKFNSQISKFVLLYLPLSLANQSDLNKDLFFRKRSRSRF